MRMLNDFALNSSKAKETSTNTHELEVLRKRDKKNLTTNRTFLLCSKNSELAVSIPIIIPIVIFVKQMCSQTLEKVKLHFDAK